MITISYYKRYLNFSLEQFQSYQLDKLRKFVGNIKGKSTFYKKRLSFFTKNIETYKDFENLPVLQQDELRKTSIDGMKGDNWDKIVTVSTSSGTTGNPKIILWTRKSLLEENKWNTLGYLLLHVKPDSKLALMMPLELSRCSSYLTACETIGTFSIPIGRIHNDVEMDNAIDKIRLLGATHLHCSTSRLIAITKRIRQLGFNIRSDYKVKYLLGGALYVSDKTRNYLEKEWGATFFDTYGANETSFIGAECVMHNGLHLLPGINYVEVVHPGTGKQITDNKSVGEALITNFSNLGTPLLRYRIGDLAVINYKKCECGLYFPRLYLRGRTAFTLFIGGTKLDAYEVETALSKFPGLTNNYQAIIEKRKDADYVKFRIECFDNLQFLSREKDTLLEALERASFEIFSKVKEGKVKISVNLIPLGILERTGRDKIKNQIIDKRTAS